MTEITMEKFLNKYKEFAERDEIKDESSVAKAILFRTFVQVSMGAQAPAPAATKAPSSRSTKMATPKQKSLINRFINEGKIDPVDVESLTLGEASKLIEQGINYKPSGSFSGSYSHQSTGSASSAALWE